MSIMPCRLEMLNNTLKTLLKTGYSLLASNNDQDVFFTQIMPDDIGAYYFIPLLAKFFCISLESAIHYFFNGVLCVGFFAAIIGCYLLSRSIGITLYAIFSFLFLYKEGLFRLSDVYIISVFSVFLIVPLSLWFFEFSRRASYFSMLWFFLCGLIAGYSHYIRSYSSFAVLFFLLATIILHTFLTVREKTILLTILVAGLIVSNIHMRFVISAAESYCKQHNSYDSEQIAYAHCFWHPVYAGLGFLGDNYLKINYTDECVVEASQRLRPGVCPHSEEYNQVLRREFLRIVRHERLFFLTTLFAKLGVIIFFIGVCANFGLIFSFFYPKGFLEYIFFISLVISALPGLIVMPRTSYLSGLIAFSFVYGVYSIIYAFRKQRVIKL